LVSYTREGLLHKYRYLNGFTGLDDMSQMCGFEVLGQ